MTERKEVQILGAFLQQVRIQTKRMVRMGLRIFHSVNR